MDSKLSSLIDFAIGYPFIGYTISLSLYAMILAQVFIYLRSGLDDGIPTKFLVFFLCILEAFHVYLLSHMFWLLLVYGRSRGVEVLLDFSWQQVAAFGVSFFVTFIVQCFFVSRVWRISNRNIILASLIAIATAAQLGSGMAFTINSARNKSPANIYSPLATRAGRVQLISSMVCDFIISASLVYYFFSLRVGTKRTNAILHQLIIISVNMGVLLCLMTAATLILFEVAVDTSFPSIPHFIISRLYVNSLIATLNSRKHMRKLADKTIEFTLPTIDAEVPSFQVGSSSVPSALG